MRFVVAPYKMGSASARHLITTLSEKVGYQVKKVDQEYEIQPGDWVINWGNGYFLARGLTAKSKLFNPRNKIALCVNKVDFFKTCRLDKKINLPDWTTHYKEALDWAGDKKLVYCREDVEGRDGRGIFIAERPSQVTACQLYTVGVPSDYEYRVHVFAHKPIFDLEKVHKHPTKEQNRIRSGSNDWHYHRDIEMPKECHEQATRVSQALGMDFCAVDILYDSKTRTATVLEANTAPELGPWTSAAYARQFISLTR